MMYGTNLLSATDKLTAIELPAICRMLKTPSEDLQRQLARLRSVKAIDLRQYARLKRLLPYFVCGNFTPPFRRIENFSSISHFILDIDKCSSKGIDLGMLRMKTQNDSRVCLGFLSPGEDGLKLMFRLKEPMYDAGLFSLFYKEFCRRFSDLYGLEQVIDQRTSDVSRACFLSADPDVFYRENPETVDINQYIDPDDTQALFDLKKEHDKKDSQPAPAPVPATVEAPEKEPDLQALEHIRGILRQKPHKEKQRLTFVPEILNEILPHLQKAIEETGLQITFITDIQYGKKIQVKLGLLSGEVNLFYGKRGFSIVQSPKRGMSEELNETLAELIKSTLDDLGL